MPELRTETMTVNMGPQHPSTHGVLNLVLELDGETIVTTRPTIGFLHTGIEKTAEQKKWQQIIPLVERMDYLGAQSNSLAFCLSVERLLGIEAQMPDRVTWIRVLIAELQRMNSHLLWLGTHGMEIGAISVMMYCIGEREQLLNLNEMLAGFRMFPSYIRVGGLREDLPRGFHEAVTAFLDMFPGKIDGYEKLLTKNDVWLRRTKDVGYLSREDTLAMGLVGPMARAVGIPYDVRRTFPYLKYDTFEFVVPTQLAGDVYARYLVKIEEMRQSVKICYSQGFNVPKGEAYVPVEGPRGEHGFYVVSDGTNRPVRVHSRAPSFFACQALPQMINGGLIADVIAVIGSTDVVMGDVDR
jgi:NADH-quinone oxidoreductase subunit D